MTDKNMGQYFAIVDYGLGNLFSIKNACHSVGIESIITSDETEITSANGIILPGVGAFTDAMMALESKNLIEPLNQCVRQDKPIIGICLGMQLLMSESYEFGHHAGLGFIKGSVLPLKDYENHQNHLKIPHIGWNRVFRYNDSIHPSQLEKWQMKDFWESTPLQGISDGEFMYFVHSYYVKPEEENVTLAISQYGNNKFCSAIKKGNIFGMQFHPERSSHCGLKIYQNIANMNRKKNW